MGQLSTIEMREAEFESESVKQLVSHTVERSEDFEDQDNGTCIPQTMHFESGAYVNGEEQGGARKVHPQAKMVLSSPPAMTESRDDVRGRTVVERTPSCPVAKYDEQLQ